MLLSVIKGRRHYLPLVIILVAFVVLHLPKITSPPLDTHAWRQSDTAAVARNFAEVSPNILMPRIDMSQQFSGITGMEFPIYNYLIFILIKLFGSAVWYGRVVSLGAAVMGLAFFYFFIRSRYNQATAAAASLILSLLPLWSYFSRNIQPDVFMVSLCIAALWAAQRYREHPNSLNLYITAGLVGLATLVKAPAILIIFPILAVLGRQQIFELVTKRYFSLLLAFGGFILVVGGWYLHSENLSNHYGLGHYFYGDLNLSLSWELIKHLTFWRVIIFVYIAPLAIMTLPLYFAFTFGLIRSLAKPDWLAIVWLCTFVGFVIIFANKSFYHNYYSLVIMPPLSLVLALGYQLLYETTKQQAAWIAVVCAVIFWSFTLKYSVSSVRPLYRLTTPSFIQLESVLDTVSSRSEKIITNGGGNPTMLYFSHHKGWSLSPDQLTASNVLTYKERGARLLVFYKPGGLPESPDSLGRTVIDNESFRIIRIMEYQ